jgi:N-acylneuraminate cytidylyltransferase
MNMIALIPAKSTSQRMPDKNVRSLAGHPLMAYSIGVAKESGLFSRVIVSTDSERYADIARHYGADVPFLRPAQLAKPNAPDFLWVFHALRTLWEDYERPDAFAILRPTSPFRTADMLSRAAEEFEADRGADSLRAVEPCRQHPGKMWVVRTNRLLPILPYELDGVPWHSNQTQVLPQVYAQNASLEMAYVASVFTTKTISGYSVMPFFTRGYEGFDINTNDDWLLAERLIQDGLVRLPDV